MAGLALATAYWLVQTPVGVVGLAASATGLVAVKMGGAAVVRGELGRRAPQAREELTPLLAAAAAQVTAYFAGAGRHFDLPCDLPGLSPFSHRVLAALAQVPYAVTVSYGELALAAGHPGAARAVGAVMAHNPLPLILPCHRVVGKNGALSGYSGGEGVATKAWLLDFEARQAQNKKAAGP
ncbi:MAG: hypothetical protein A2091_09980 [Desulfuromonadales bacterium GWD2_61_12]|nr:MAG: hypothetical protein A2091_09980 [Desulfuromonadales bacterium GWD2_61_12]